jgi:cytochrome c
VKHRSTPLILFTALVGLGLATPVGAFDADAAKATARQNNCFKCHAVGKSKDGPDWLKIAAKYRGKPDAVERIIFHITSGELAKFPDGHQEEHKIAKTSDPAELQNLAEWILSLE